MEWKIGEIKQVNGEWYQCVEGKTICSECDLRNIICQRDTSINNPFKECSGNYRTDKKNIIFKKLEKVGEPYYSKYYGKFYQKYITYIPAVGNNFKIRVEPVEHVGRNEIFIEIKQTKEDMEEKKLNLKPFDLQKAKAGKPVCTKDGRKARIVCFDRNDLYPIVALIECEDGKEMIGAYSKEGCTEIYEIKGTDLMMLPEKKEGWVNIYRGQVYNTFEKAEEARKIAEHGGDNYLKTIKIDWEE